MINVEKEIGGKVLSLQTGKIARQSAGSVVLTYGETVLLIAVNAAEELERMWIFSLSGRI